MESISADKEEHQQSLRKMKAFTGAGVIGPQRGEEGVHLEKVGQNT